MRILPIQNSNMSFKSIYKVKAHDINDDVANDIQHYKFGIVPSSQVAPEYFYLITPNVKFADEYLEKDILSTGGSYWKSKPLKEIANNKLCEQIFNLNKAMNDNKENWVAGEQKQSDEIPF